MCNGRYWKQKGSNKNENQSSAELPNCKNVQRKILEANGSNKNRKQSSINPVILQNPLGISLVKYAKSQG